MRRRFRWLAACAIWVTAVVPQYAATKGISFAVGHLLYQVTSPPLQITSACPGPTGTVGVPYSFPLTATGAIGIVSWFTDASLPPGLSLNSSTGVLGGLPSQAGTFPVYIVAGDYQRSAVYSCGIVIVSPPGLSLTATCPAAVGVQGAPYFFSITATGGAGALSWQLSQGPLPPGLSLNSSTGAIAGIPSASGTFPILVRITDSGQGSFAQSVSYPCSLIIGLPVTPPVTTPDVIITSGCPAATAAQGSPYSQILTASGGLNTGFIFSISQGALPAGLRLNGDRISGTPAGPPGTSRFSIQVSSGDATAQLACSITVTGPQLQVTSGCPANGTVGLPYLPFLLLATGGSGPGTYTFSIPGGSLPAGLTLAGNSISGTPQGPPGPSAPFNIQVSSGNATATAGPCTITIAAPPLAITGTCPATVQAGAPVSASVTVSGGKAPYTFSFTGSQGLSFSNGAVSGTLATPGTGSFAVTVSDAANSPAQTFSCSFPVTAPANPLQIAASCPAGSIAANAPFSLPLGASGGTGTYAWSLSGPSWLSLNATSGTSVTASGTPPSAGPASFTVTLSDGPGVPSATFACSVQVVARLQITSTANCPASPIDFQTPVSIGLSVSGGTAPFRWVYSGPQFLSLSSTTGASTTVSGPATASGAASLSVTVTDSANTPSATFTCAFTVRPAVVPPITLTVSSAIALTPAGAVVSLSAPAPEDLAGTVTLTFKSSATNPLDNNPQVHFSSPAGTTFNFTLPKGAQTVTLPLIEQGSVAGTIHLQITDLRAGSDNVLPAAGAFADIIVPGLKPVITNQFPAASAAGFTFENETSNGFDIVISGYSTPRDLSSASVTFTAASGTTLEGSATFTVPLGNVSNAYYQSAKSTAAGSLFTGLRIPVTITGDKSVIASVTVVLTNSVGSSDAVTKSR